MIQFVEHFVPICDHKNKVTTKGGCAVVVGRGEYNVFYLVLESIVTNTDHKEEMKVMCFVNMSMKGSCGREKIVKTRNPSH